MEWVTQHNCVSVFLTHAQAYCLADRYLAFHKLHGSLRAFQINRLINTQDRIVYLLVLVNYTYFNENTADRDLRAQPEPPGLCTLRYIVP